MRNFAFVFLMLPLAAGCTPATNPFTAPLPALTSLSNPARGATEVFVKTNHSALIRDLRTGGGPVLTQAYDTARVPDDLRPVQTLRLQSDLQIYQTNPGALVTAILAASGT